MFILWVVIVIIFWCGIGFICKLIKENQRLKEECYQSYLSEGAIIGDVILIAEHVLFHENTKELSFVFMNAMEMCARAKKAGTINVAVGDIVDSHKRY